MRTAATTFISIFFYMSLNAQSPEKIELWPAKVPGEEKPKSEARFADNRDRNVTRIAEVTNPLLEVYRPAKPNGAAVVICPGGGYNILAIDLEGYEVAEWLAGLGYTAFVLQYRVPQKQEGALQDAQRAIRLVRSQAGKYGIDPDKIGVLGFSAGGSLAARVSTRFNDNTYSAMDAADQLSARPAFSVLIYPAYLDQGENLTLTPELVISAETPPMYIFATADDKYANSSLVMTQALREHEIPVELHILPAGGHGYGLRKGSEAAEFWPERAEKWLMKWVGSSK
ncbi:MAG: alpha/beta hydrolase [Cyclobacteriaceae bacterium]|nr:alpha/beta hydrolase [Cyclobacteriaceae bacterium]